MASEEVKQTYNVQVAGVPLRLRSSHDQQTVDQLVEIVSEKVEEVLNSGKSVSFQNALLLSSLHLAEELVLLKRLALDEIDGVQQRAEKILSDLEEAPTVQANI